MYNFQLNFDTYWCLNCSYSVKKIELHNKLLISGNNIWHELLHGYVSATLATGISKFFYLLHTIKLWVWDDESKSIIKNQSINQYQSLGVNMHLLTLMPIQKILTTVLLTLTMHKTLNYGINDTNNFNIYSYQLRLIVIDCYWLSSISRRLCSQIQTTTKLCKLYAVLCKLYAVESC